MMAAGPPGPSPSPTPSVAGTRASLDASLDLAEERMALLCHELRQPLFIIALANETLRVLLRQGAAAVERMERALTQIDDQVQYAQAIVECTLDHARGKAAGNAATAIDHALDRALAFLSPVFAAGRIAIARPPVEAAPLTVAIGPVELEQILVNILRNAADSIAARRRQGWDDEGRIAITFLPGTADICCMVADNGAGLAAGMPERNFRPFFTTKGAEGNGLGLCVCEQLAAQAGGSIRLLPGKSTGARCEIVLPLAGRGGTESPQR